MFVRTAADAESGGSGSDDAVDATNVRAQPNPPLDFRRLFESAMGSCLVIDSELAVVAVTDAFFDVLAGHGAGALSDLREICASLDRVRETRTPDTLAVQRCDRPRPNGECGGIEVRYLSRTTAPVVDADGAVAYLLHSIRDVTAILASDGRRTAGADGDEALPLADFDLDEAVRGVVDLLAASAHEKGLALRYDVGVGVPVRVLGDALRIRQVLTSLADNGVRFTHAGSVTVGVTVADGRTRFSVTDTGIGIDPVARPGLLHVERAGGTGQGLAMCARLVESMGGVLEYESRLGRGSTFWFDLPLDDAHRPPAPKGEAALEASTPRGSTGARILLADDAEINQVVGVALLERLGYRVDVVADGAEALAAVQRTAYDAVLMDCLMPVMDGYEATARVRRLDGAAGQTPIIATTASAMVGDREKCLAAGMNDYISKPLDPKALAAALARCHRPYRPGTSGSADHSPSAVPAVELTGADAELIEGLKQLEEAIGPVAFASVRASFLQTCSAEVHELVDAVGAGDAEATRRLAHAFKGSMASLGAHRLSRIAARLEHPGEPGASAAAIEELHCEFARVHDVLRRSAGSN
jgi:CheY-like chemotaxis protein/HPt (histidine-containing phosphotransfer) domain-containing protein